MSGWARILVVEDERASRVTLAALLESEGHRVEACETAGEALKRIADESELNIVISDLKLPDGNGLQILWALKKINPNVAFILTTGHASVENAAEAVNQGAFAYHVKPLDIDALNSSVRNALKQQQLTLENQHLVQRLRLSNAGLSTANRNLQEKNRQLDEVSQAKTQILATVTHELKTPLTSITGYVDRLLLERDKVGLLNEKQERYLDRVRENSRRLQHLIDDLLDVARIESGSLGLPPVDLELLSEIEEVVRSLQPQLDDKQTRVLLNIPGGLGPVRADQLRFSQIVANLLSNACKYCPRGAGGAVSAAQNGEMVQINVSDSGPGIPKVDQPQLFTKFFRGTTPRPRQVPGTGLGLYIVKHLVEAQGGSIWLQSAEGEGCTFTFTLPLAGAAQKDQTEARPPEGMSKKSLPLIRGRPWF